MMLDCAVFFDELKKNKIGFFTGVPDSLLKNICAFITDHVEGRNHIIAANEGNSVGLASGHYIATGNPALVYMQNSGQGNAINPLLSLADSDVYGIPMLLMIGWRGEPEVNDEPQHYKQGLLTLKILDTLGYKYEILSTDEKEMKNQIQRLVSLANETRNPVCLVVRKNTFAEYSLIQKQKSDSEMSRENAIEIITEKLNDHIFVSTTGKISRELFEIRESRNESHNSDFLTIGSMGHCSQIALGVAIEKPDKNFVCLDGDGAVIMQMGGIAIIGQQKPKNFYHIVLNNNCHDSVGGQPTASPNIDYVKLAYANGYQTAFSVSDSGSLNKILNEIHQAKTPLLLEVKVKPGSRSDLGRPTITPKENLKNFMENVQ